MTPGVVVRLDGHLLPSVWLFYTKLEPALVFGRAGRMSADVSSWALHPAACEVRFDPHLHADVRTLYVGAELVQPDDLAERDFILDWVRAV